MNLQFQTSTRWSKAKKNRKKPRQRSPGTKHQERPHRDRSPLNPRAHQPQGPHQHQAPPQCPNDQGHKIVRAHNTRALPQPDSQHEVPLQKKKVSDHSISPLVIFLVYPEKSVTCACLISIISVANQRLIDTISPVASLSLTDWNSPATS